MKIDGKSVLNKTIFFVLLVGFIILFSVAFGQKNMLIGVMIVVAALMLLPRDLTVRPLFNLTGLIILNLTLGLGAYLSLIDPWLGIVVNFSIIFFTTYLLMHSLRSPLYFPFILGYGFITSMPVTAEELPLRMLSLLVGALFILALNIIVNWKKSRGMLHSGITGLLKELGTVARMKSEGRDIDITPLEEKVRGTISSMHWKVRDRYFTSLSEQSSIRVALSVRMIARSILNKKYDCSCLHDLAELLDLIADEDKKFTDQNHTLIESFISRYPELNKEMISALKTIDIELELASKCNGKINSTDVPKGFSSITFLKENFRGDSIKFTFAVRMAIMLTFWLFLGDYFELENARWLVFTSIALILPYIEGAAKKSRMRIVGTLIGAAIFILLTPLTYNEDVIMLLMLGVGYLATLFDNPNRYDMNMVFVTLSALLMASVLFPGSPVIEERLLYIGIGVVCAMVANHIILPYRIVDETRDLSNRYMSIVRNHIRELKAVLEGKEDRNKGVALVVTSYALSDKIKMNNEADPRQSVDTFLEKQDLIMEEGSYLKITSNTQSVSTIQKSIDLINSYGPDGEGDVPGNFTSNDDYVNNVVSLLRTYHESNNDRKMIFRYSIQS